MKALRMILFIVLIVIGIFLTIGLFLPSEWQVSRSIVIKSSPQAVYEYVADLKKWPQWSPWDSQKDPTLKYTYEGPDMGVGAMQHWESRSMGVGWLKITQADPAQGISYTLFIDMGNWQSTIEGRLAFEEQPDGVKVIWTDAGDHGNHIIKKWMGLFIKPMLGANFEVGLDNLKKLVEKSSS